MLKVLTSAVNNPIFIEIQYHTLKKHLKNDYEFIVFNDAKNFPDYTNGGDITVKQQISDMCKSLDIKCINIENDHHANLESPCTRCAQAMNHMLKYQLLNPAKYLVIDSDMFLIDDFDIEKEYSGYNMAVVPQKRQWVENNRLIECNYFWNGLHYFNIPEIQDKELLNWSLIEDFTDVGGMMHKWVDKHIPEEYIPNTDYIRKNDNIYSFRDIYFIRHLWSITWDETELPENIKNKKLINFLKKDPRNQKGKFYCEIYDKKFLHYRAGGNWNRMDINLHKFLSNKLRKILI